MGAQSADFFFNSWYLKVIKDAGTRCGKEMPRQGKARQGTVNV
jgi:hypothetical protein